MSEDFNKTQLSNIILVKNLPPGTTVDQVEECFSKYGNVMACSMCISNFLNTVYSFQMCYVKFDCNDPIIDIFENDLDIILNGYYLEIETVIDNPLIWSSVIILGIGVNTKLQQVEEVLEQFNSPKIMKFHEAEITDNGYCIVQFPSPSYVKACLDCQNEIEIAKIHCSIKAFPQPDFRYVRVSPKAFVFQNLIGVEQFNDFTFITPEKNYPCSSMVAAFSCSKIRDIVESQSPISSFKINTSGNFQVIIDAIYGHHVNITKNICKYVYAVSSILGFHELRRVASLVCYELLTPENVIQTFNTLRNERYPCDYVIEFIATHVSQIPQIDSLPSVTIQNVFRHPIFKAMSKDEILVLARKIPNVSDILLSQTINISSIEEIREYIIAKLDALEDLEHKVELISESIHNQNPHQISSVSSGGGK